MAVSESLVSVIVPCFNQAEYLTEALTSVLEQTYHKWECIVVNDGSNDNTEDIALDFVSRDNRFKYLKKENGGLSSARNAGINKSCGVYILPLDADDKIACRYIERAVQTLDKESDVKIVYAKAEFFGAISGVWELQPFSMEDIALSNMIFCTAFFRRSDYDFVGGYDIDFRHGYEDWDFWLSLLCNGGNVKQLPEINFYYRKKNSSMLETLGRDQNMQMEIKKKIYVKHIDFYTRLFGDPLTSLCNHLNFEKLKIQNDYLLKSKSYRLGNFIINLFLFKWKK